MEAFEAEKKSLQEHTEKAHNLQVQASVEAGLTVRQRWRIPIVFVKVSKGNRLSAEDTLIWQHVTSRIKTEADAARVTGVFETPIPLPAVVVPSPTSRKPSNANISRTNSRLSPKVSPRPIVVGPSRVYTATTASSRMRIQGEEELFDKTPPAGGKSRKPSMKKSASKRGGLSPKAGSGLKRKRKKRNPLSGGDSVMSTSKPSSGGTDCQSGDFDDDDDDEDVDPEMRSTLDRFVSAMGSISTSIKHSFSFSRSKILPTEEEEEEVESREEATLREGRLQLTGAHSAYAADFAEQQVQEQQKESKVGDKPSAADDGLEATVRALTPNVSMIDCPMPSASAAACNTIDAAAAAHNSSLGATNRTSVKAVRKKRASFLVSFLSLGGFGASSTSEKTTDFADAGIAVDGGGDDSPHVVSRKQPASVLGSVAQLFSGLFGGGGGAGAGSGRKQSFSDVHSVGSKGSKHTASGAADAQNTTLTSSTAAVNTQFPVVAQE